jgi:signal transduction histidine kinase
VTEPRRRTAAINVSLGLVFALVLVGTAVDLASEGRDWLLGTGVGALVCGAALLREFGRRRAAAVGLLASLAAALLARFADLPREPGLAATLALFVLASSAVRRLPWRSAVWVAAGVVVLPVGWLTPQSSGTSHADLAAGLVGWCAALAGGLALRLRDERRRAAVESVRQQERMALARELHDVVAAPASYSRRRPPALWRARIQLMWRRR